MRVFWSLGKLQDNDLILKIHSSAAYFSVPPFSVAAIVGGFVYLGKETNFFGLENVGDKSQRLAGITCLIHFHSIVYQTSDASCCSTTVSIDSIYIKFRVFCFLTLVVLGEILIRFVQFFVLLWEKLNLLNTLLD
jgi:hypothetical protein